MDPVNDLYRDKLSKAMELSYRQLRPYRTLVSGLVEEYAGSSYTQQESTKPRYEMLINLMNQAVDAYTMSLAANRPRILMSTEHAHLKFFAKQFEVATNNLIKEIQLETILRQWVLDAFFSLGIVKAHMADSGEVELEAGFWMDPGIPFASNVSLDNWVHDMSATQWHKVQYAGDSYRLPIDEVKSSDIYDPDVVAQLEPTSKYHASNDEDRVENISRGYDTDTDEFESMVDLMDIWLPRSNKIFTFAMDPARRFVIKGKPLAVMPHNGPEFGPYHHLSFIDIPDNILPSSPAAHLASLARLANNILRKQSRQAKRQKDVYPYTPGGAESAKKVQRSSDGDFVEVQSQDDIGLLKMGGVDAGNQAFFGGVVGLFDRMAGNLSAMAGLGPQADTATQETLIHGQVSKKEAHMQYRVLEATTRLVRDLGWMLWNDQAKVIPGEIPLEGTDYSIPTEWTPEDREGNFLDYNFEIDVFSMPYQSPAQRVQALTQLVTGVYTPLMPLMQQQGGSINIQALTEIYSDLLNLPRLKDVIQFTAPSQEPEVGPQTGQEQATQANTTRNYVRRSVPTGGTQQSRQHVEQQAWLTRSGQNNQDQEAQLQRSV